MLRLQQCKFVNLTSTFFSLLSRATHLVNGKQRIHTCSKRENALLYLTLIKLIVIRFVGTGGFLTTYSKGNMK